MLSLENGKSPAVGFFMDKSLVFNGVSCGGFGILTIMIHRQKDHHVPGKMEVLGNIPSGYLLHSY